MKKILLALVVPLLAFATHGSPRIEDSLKGRDTILKVLTHEDLAGALIEVKGPFEIRSLTSDKKIFSSKSNQRHYLSATPEGLQWGKVFKNTHQFEVVPKKKSTTTLIDGIQYKGKLYAFDITSKIHLVVEISVDDYVKSVLSEQFAGSDIHQTALEALAISMRTDLYQKIAASNNPFWDIQASDHNFRGSSLFTVGNAAERAVNATKDLIMIYKNRPFPTTWSEDCAGKTTAYKTVFRKDVECPNGIFVPFAQKMRSDHKWKCSISKRDLAKALEIDSIQSIETYKCSTTQKIYGLRVNGRNLNFREVNFLELQKLIGKHRILSNDFSISLIDKRVEFSGFGKGLGVGICLLSAKEMAKSGTSTSKMLSTFYPDTKLIKLEFVPQVFFEEEEAFDGE